ncbi:polysaccharide pyruvyl transferase family protein [Tessaracoccus oleiagri]|uniref:Polysaccharide pyruvyl transferase family protein WcaK n=1 Tax=Tessaracoccus oleiagri TaxID=686624 RepID=A0A1G9N920_9ACTN|nr:polysaccharide pyruvyl transferase family protein [Tessaracoccus oleiagri]SDL82627.1 Polysaccharide pyruvyl transferase family protein WcaK [Tessaracoccus oleiagri]
MRIGFLGIQCDNANLGVAALAYAGLHLVHRLAPSEAEFVLFSDNSVSGIDRMRTALGIGERRIRAVPFRHRSPRHMARSVAAMAGCDAIVDFSGGDSFSDLYGAKRLAKLLLHKELAILTRTPLVLAPQTYGPFQRRWSRPLVRHVLDRAALVFSRDDPSAEYVAGLVDREVIVATDVAVTLPWRRGVELEGAEPAVGFNVSGLLWRGGYTGRNQFHLVADYRAYCDEVVAALLDGGFSVHLVSHVGPAGRPAAEDDLTACRELQRRHPRARLSPPFGDPVEAKSWIAATEVFIGSRMHATIAAFTSGVPVVPAAYSRKFAGLFGSLGYEPLVDLTVLDAGAAAALTLGLVHDRARLAEQVALANERAQARISIFPERLEALLGAEPSWD